MREGYKKTIAGFIPSEWDVEKLNKLVEKITDGTHKTPTYTDTGIPFLRVVDIQKQSIDWENVKYISEKEHQELIKRCRPDKGDILYSKNGTIGIPKIIDWDTEFSIFVSLCLIKMKKAENILFNMYFAYYLNSDNCIKQIKLRAKQGTVTNLHLEEIRELEIPVPQFVEQQKIAEILSTVDERIQQTDTLIEKIKELKKGLMQRMLTKGIGHTEFKKTEVGEIPVEWEVKKLDDISANYKNSIVDGPFGSNLKTSDYKESGVLVLQSNYITGGKFKLNDVRYISFEKAKELERSKARSGEILMAKIGANFGSAEIIPQHINYGILSSNAMKIDLNQNIASNLYCLYYIKHLRNIGVISKLASVTAQPALSLKTIKDLKIPVPPLEEQQKIASILSSVDTEIDKLQGKKQKLQTLKQGLMQKLLTGKIRVKVS